MSQNPETPVTPRRLWPIAALSLCVAAAVVAAALMAQRRESRVLEAPPPGTPAPDGTSRAPVGTTASNPGVIVCFPIEPLPAPDKLRQKAKEYADGPDTTARQGLAKYAESEHYVREAILHARQSKSPDEASFTDTYKALLRESDEYAKRVITPAFVESIPWTDLLSREMAAKWSRTTTNSGPACRVENGVLTAQPGVFGVLDQKNDNLCHFMLDMEFEVDGIATMFLHVSSPPASPDNRLSPTFDLSSKDGGLVPNQPCSLTAVMIGSRLEISWTQNGETKRWDDELSWHKLRRGGIAFLIPEGTRLKVTRMRIRELR